MTEIMNPQIADGPQEFSRPTTGVKLFEYQEEAVAWLMKKKCALLSLLMGMGKTAVSIVAADRLNLSRILVICPAVARVQWEREFRKFSSKQRDFILVHDSYTEIPNDSSVIISYDLCTRLGKDVLGIFDVIILDEVHYTKNPHAKRTQKLFSKGGLIHGQKPQTKIWCLSGTPAPNHAGELWVLLHSFGATSLRYDNFLQRFSDVYPSPFGKGVRVSGTKRSAIPELRSILAKIMLRKTWKEVGSMLPEIFYSSMVVEAGKVDLELESSFIQYVFPNNRIQELEDKLKSELAQTEKAVSMGNVKLLEGLAKSVSTLRRYVGVQKVEKVAELVKGELESDLYDKIVIFAIHRDVIEGLRVRLKEFGAVTLYGGSKFKDAHKNIDKFMTNPKCRVFIGNIAACGIAINLTSAHQVLMIEQEWTPAANAQAVARCHRHGQSKTVSVRMVGLANSLDEKICEILKKKTEELTSVFDSTTTADTLENLLA